MAPDEIVREGHQACYRFDDVVIDVQNLQLTVGGEIRPLEPKVFRLLQFLAENHGRVVSKEEILRAVWEGTFVTDNALTRAITQIRKALNDDPKQPRYIETVPTVGYRFIAEPSVESQPSAIIVPDSRNRRPLVLGGIVAALLVLGGILIARFVLVPKGAAPTGLQAIAQLSNGGGLDVNASYSPDGKFIAYASDRTGSFEIYVRSQSSARELQLTNNNQENLFPRFSPDGQFIVFSSSKSPGVLVVPALGGPIRRLTTFGAMPAWSPDGSQIVFVSHTGASLATTDYYWYADSTLWLIPAEGGEPHQITFPVKPLGGQSFPSWSPNGKSIRFVNYLGLQASIWTYQLSDSKVEKRFDNSIVGATYGSPTFTRDDRRMLYVSSTLNGDIGIWQIPLDPATLKPTGKPEPVFRPGLGVPRDLSLSPDGKRILYSAVLASSRLLVQPMDGDRTSGVPASLLHDVSYRFTQAKWFSDSKRIAFTRFPIGQTAQSWRVGIDGSGAEPISASPYNQYFPRPLDGPYVAFAESRGKRMFRRVSLLDGSVTDLGEATGADQVNFAADGSGVVFHDTSQPVLHLSKLDFKSGKRTQLTFGPESSGFGHYSADSKWISFEVIKSGISEIAVISSSGGAPETIWSGQGRWFASGWSPDSEKILVAGNDGGGWALYILSRRTHQLVPLTKTLALRVFVRYPEWSPDGKNILYEFNESKGNVFQADLP